MTYNKNGPLCRYCGEAIPKKTQSVWFGGVMAGSRPEKPKSRAEVQKLTNCHVTSLKWDEMDGERYIRDTNVWDRRSYIDPFFCSGKHAKWFGEMCAEQGSASAAYTTAMMARNKS